MSSTNAPVVTVFGDPTDAPDGRTLTVSQGLHLIDNGPGETLNIAPSDRLASLATMDSDGMVSYNSTTKIYSPLQLIGTNGISIENPFGVGGNPIFSLNPASSVQLLRFANGSGQVQVTAPQINFAAGAGVDLSITNVGSNAAALLTISATGTGGATVDISDGGTGLTSLAPGSLIIGPPSGNVASTVPIGSAANGLMYSTGTIPAWMTTSPMAGQTVIYNGTALVWTTPPSGTLSSIGLTQTGSHFTITNTPLTANGNINISLNDLGLDVGGLGVTTLAEGSIPYGPASGNVVSTLAIGSAANGLMYSTGTVPAWMATSPTTGQTVTYNGTALVWTTPPSGTLTSVGLTQTGSHFTITNTPLTGSGGNINISLNDLGLDVGGLGVTTLAEGSIPYGPASGNVVSTLAIGSAANGLMYSTGIVPAWMASSPTSGETVMYNGTTLVWTPLMEGTLTSVGLTQTGSNFTITNTPLTGTGGNINISLNTLDLSVGGLGVTTLAEGSIPYGPASGNVVSTLAIGSAANGLMYSTGTVPAWMTTSPTSGETVMYNGTTLVWTPLTGGTLTSVGLTQTGSHFTITNTPLTGSGGNINISLNDLGLDVGGLGVTTLAQGSIPYGPASGNVVSTLAIGSAANGLMYSTGTVPAWMTTSPTTGQTVIYNGIALVWTTPTVYVSSVGLTQPGSDFTISGSPVTGSSSISISLNTVGISHGGSGLTSLAQGSITYGPASGNVVSTLAIGSAANGLMYSTGTVPAWMTTSPTSGETVMYNGTTLVWTPLTSGTLTSVGLTQTGSHFTITNTPLTGSGGNINISLNDLGLDVGGLGVTTLAQGSIPYGPASGNVVSTLAIGSAANGLMYSTGTVPAWMTTSPTTGQTVTYNGTALVWTTPTVYVSSVGLTQPGSDFTISGSPVTGSSSISISLNTVGISHGGSGLTSLAQGSIPYGPASGNVVSTLAIGSAANGLMYSTGTVPAWMATSPTTGQTVTYNGTALVWTTPTVYVSSVGLTQPGSDFTISGSPVTGSSSISISLNTVGISHGGSGLTSLAQGSIPYGPASGNVVSTLAIGSAANGLMYSTGTVPAWMATSPTTGQTVMYNGTTLVWTTPLTSVGLTQTGSNFTITNTPLTANGNINIALNTVGISSGGTGLTSLAQGSLIVGPASGNVASTLAAGANETIISSNGTTPSYVTRNSLGIVYGTTLTGAATCGVLSNLTGSTTVNTTAIKTGYLVMVNPISDTAGVLGARGYTLGYGSIVDSTSFQLTVNLNGSTNVSVNWIIVPVIST